MLIVRHGTREFLCEPGTELHTDLGVITVPTDAAPGDIVETHLGERFTVRPFRSIDFLDHLDRSGAPMMPRDVGLIVGHTGIQAGDRVLDAGTGTGVLACTLGRLGVTVHTYEIDEEAADLARENVRRAGVEDNVDVRSGDVTDALEDLAGGEPYEAITLDTADAPRVVEKAPAILVVGGAVAAYTPFIEGARTVHEAATDHLDEARTYETIQREMDFDDRGSRPTTSGVGHTGYLTVARR